MEGTKDNIMKARLIMTLADMLEKTALPGEPQFGWWNATYSAANDKNKAKNKKLCEDGQKKMKELADKCAPDDEVQKVLDLGAKYCSRF
jgi:hypothetical protein